ncbi:hypothetical protein QYM36_002895 [Artemia franciscana]|uniref:Uncharacterized protein n=1 Tax=Artemia franciscana TaxID=6661 RepID=A0AA88L9V8_ARTSF|nr:hypothetical protein QYM36_002894 [Artemia franciscana]KAK2722502.1 hypothetical protein QYM36_002895 [Artemia franciscana]
MNTLTSDLRFGFTTLSFFVQSVTLYLISKYHGHIEDRQNYFRRQREELQQVLQSSRTVSSDLSPLSSSTTVGDSPTRTEPSPTVAHHPLPCPFFEGGTPNQNNTWHGDQAGASPIAGLRQFERLHDSSQSSSTGTSPTNQKRRVLDEDFFRLVNELTASGSPSQFKFVGPSLNQLRSGHVKMFGPQSPTKEGPVKQNIP